IGIGGILVTLRAEIDRRDHIPALALLGMLAEPRLDTGDERTEVLAVGGIFEPRFERLVWKAGRAVEEIEPERDNRHRNGNDGRCDARALCLGLSARSGVLLAVGLQQAPCNLEPRGLGLAVPDQAARAVGFDLAELIAIDGGVERLAWSLALPGRKKRPQQDVENDCREASEDEPNQQGRLTPPLDR